ncbi:MAG: class II fructose-bisphosphate aldolase [Candidatus Thiodiazotropha sp. (ex Dulcina madagascariensis)]|nr:class II fructose-bisphosphate aldolase [Candidatus Thiodiazotropha sp. (ex Dulcina madagascariensis)]
MPLIKMRDMLEHAQRNAYAIGAFDLTDLNYLKAILDASERTGSPVVLNLRESTLGHAGLEWMMPAVLAAAKRATVPVAVHFSHGVSVDSAIRAINLGCGSVMLDGLTKATGDYIESTGSLAALAHGCDCAVEGLLDLDELAMPGKVYDCMAQMKVDSLVLNIESEPQMKRLIDLEPNMTMPLTAYLNIEMGDEHHRRLIDRGVTRICCAAALIDVVNQRVNELAVSSGALSLGGLLDVARTAAGAEVERRQTLWGCAGRAEQLSAESRPCREVEHLIIYNVDEARDDVVAAMMAEGRKTLGGIPGVRRIFTGRSVRQDAAYQYCWLVRFSDETVIDSYRDHPDHLAFADTRFRPIAGDRISIDYEEVE